MAQKKPKARSAPRRTSHSRFARLRDNPAMVVLLVLLVAVFAMGNGARDDIASLPILRPLAVLCLGIGLHSMTRETWRSFRLPLGFMLAILVYILLHLVPLPPALWTALPGRDLAVEAGEAVGGTQPWRPLALVPYRGWNAFFAMLVPAAAMVLATQLKAEQHRTLLYLAIAFGLASAAWAIVQAVGGFSPSLYLYSVTNSGVPNGLFANRNHHAALLVILLPMLALVASRARGGSRRVWQVGGGAIGSVLLLLTLASGSRGAIVFSVLSLAACILVIRAGPETPRRRRSGSRNLTPYFVGAVALVAIVCFAIITSRAESIDRLVATDSLEEGRPIVWNTIVSILPDYLPFGSGVGSFVEIFQIHEPATMLTLNYWNHAHNDWLEWALEGGIPAVALMGFALFAWGARTRRLLRQGYAGRLDVQLGLVGATIILILGLWSVVDYPLRVPSMACFAALAAVWMVVPGSVRAAGQARYAAETGERGGTGAVVDSGGK